MLSPIAKKFVGVLKIETQANTPAGELLPDGYSVAYGNFSSHIENGVKVRNATLYLNGKIVATYDAATDQVYQ